ncbi:cholesterol 7-alpha-monooxygenase-like [Pomacea canaliculata]|uniref:cholesterol 7-alpha-monooxygenase-like n=1 Tax=Pomacea canaliculata TaxID=400727 RepID=UPI000D72ED4E|nr:cholesterol 7-alpha-monooxygenase-like [Pomacea canaliculata]
MLISGVFILVIFLVLVAYLRFTFRIRRKSEPPYVPGHFLWGNSAQFSKHHVRFLQTSQKQLGDIFTIRLLNHYFTVIMDPHCYETFVKVKNFDFFAIMHQVLNNVFALEVKSSRKLSIEIAKRLKGMYVNTTMDNFAKHVQNSFTDLTKTSAMTTSDCNANINTDGNTSVDWRREMLFTLMSKTMFPSLFYTLFGRSVDPSGEEKTKNFCPKVFHDNFNLFHKYFTYLWIGLPLKLFPQAVEALTVLLQQPTSHNMLRRDGVSEQIKVSINHFHQHGHSEQDIALYNLVIFHVNYNTFRAAYWCVYKLAEDPRILKDLERELHEAIEMKRADGEESVAFTLAEIGEFPLLDSFWKETLRMYSGTLMTRYITEDTEFEMPSGQKYTVRKGDRAVMCAAGVHMDPEIFEDPEVFKHKRFVNTTFYKYGKELKKLIFSFGSLCPGQRSAILQGKWFLMNLINSFSLQLPEGQKAEPNTEKYGNEILPPVNDVQIDFRPKEGAPVLVYSK